jgi:hypothetical protein
MPDELIAGTDRGGELPPDEDPEDAAKVAEAKAGVAPTPA